MTVKLPEEWKELWAIFDARFEQARDAYQRGGISRWDISKLMSLGLGEPASKFPPYIVWAAIRHNASGFGDILDAIEEKVHGKRPSEMPTIDTKLQ